MEPPVAHLSENNQNTMKAFDTNKYLKIQKELISRLVAGNEDLWCIEVGGKLIQDRHAARVLPGFHEDARFEFVKSISRDCDIVMVVSAQDIARKRIRGDFKTTYDDETFRSIQELNHRGLKIHHIAVSRINQKIEKNQQVINFFDRLNKAGYSYSKHCDIENYSLGEFSKQDISTADTIPLANKKVVVISPGGGSGKFGICLTILFQAMQAGKKPHYFSIGAFPIYDLPTTHPLNLAYLAATADFDDALIEDPNSQNSILTEREKENYALLQKLCSFFESESENLRSISSATDMCVSVLSKGIIDEEVARKEAAAEVARRYMRYKIEIERGEEDPAVADRVRRLFDLL
jgi:uncharacterized protein (UPF0371 family)